MAVYVGQEEEEKGKGAKVLMISDGRGCARSADGGSLIDSSSCWRQSLQIAMAVSASAACAAAARIAPLAACWEYPGLGLLLAMNALCDHTATNYGSRGRLKLVICFNSTEQRQFCNCNYRK